LDASQTAAVAELDEQLSDEAEALSMLQQKAMHQTETHNRNECTELEQKIELRRTLLDQKVSTSLADWCLTYSNGSGVVNEVTL